MSLFKILKGDSSRISTDVTPFHDGWAYFTPDDGGFYIDSEDNGEQKRHRINPNTGGGSSDVSATLLASAWSAGQQTVAIEGMTADTDGVGGISQLIADAELEAVKSAELYVCGQGDGTLTIAAFGDVPTCDIPIVVILLH